ncbi:MAG: Mur ligase family protein [Pseudomonadota bacterium]
MVNKAKRYFFCGIGGSGMLPLALILKGKGAMVAGSDRALDQGRTPEKFDYLRALGVDLFPQNGSGLVSGEQTLVASAAVEDTVPDVAAANRVGAPRLSRAQLLATLFNDAPFSVAVGGTSGKSTVTAMTGWIYADASEDPTIMNGAVMKNFVTDKALFASARVGRGPSFISEVDESDGSIALFAPTVAVLNNISLDHKSMDELRALFGEFVGKAETAVINRDDAEAAALTAAVNGRVLSHSLTDAAADFHAGEITPEPFGVSFTAHGPEGARARVALTMPGRHNVSNALAALCAAHAGGIALADAAASLSRFEGVKRRFELVGAANGVTVIDDFGHNPDKIAATLRTLHDFPGRLLIMFQPHGFGPLKKMKQEFIDCFSHHLKPDDHLLMPQPVYYGGTVDRAVTSKDIAAGVRAAGRNAQAFETRDDCGAKLLDLARDGDRIIVMGARDDTLSEFAAGLVASLRQQG